MRRKAAPRQIKAAALILTILAILCICPLLQRLKSDP